MEDLLQVQYHDEGIDVIGKRFYSDPVKMIITEPVSNALDEDANKILIYTHPQTRTLSINDNGNGMTKSKLNDYLTIFTPDKRINPSRIDGKKKIGQFGMGRTICWKLCKSFELLTKSESGFHIHIKYLPKQNKFKVIKETPPLRNKGTVVNMEGIQKSIWKELTDKNISNIISNEFSSEEIKKFKINDKKVIEKKYRGNPTPFSFDFARVNIAKGTIYWSEKPLSPIERGVDIFVVGRKVGPSFFGLKGGLIDNINGYVEADSLQKTITAGRDGFNIKHKLFEAFEKKMQTLLRHVIEKELKKSKDKHIKFNSLINKNLKSMIKKLWESHPDWELRGTIRRKGNEFEGTTPPREKEEEKTSEIPSEEMEKENKERREITTDEEKRRREKTKSGRGINITHGALENQDNSSFVYMDGQLTINENYLPRQKLDELPKKSRIEALTNFDARIIATVIGQVKGETKAEFIEIMDKALKTMYS